MIRNNEPIKPSFYKMRDFDDIVSYCINTKKIINDSILLKHGFIPLEIEWLDENKGEMIKMNNRKIIEQTNNIIKELKSENEILKKKIELLENKPNNENKLSFLKVNDEKWCVVEDYMNSKNNHVKSNHIIPNKNVVSMFKIVSMLTDKDKPMTSYRKVVKSLLNKHGWSIDIDSFNGGRNRSKYFFKYYYFPIKILQFLNYIEYGYRGKIKMLNFDNNKVLDKKV